MGYDEDLILTLPASELSDLVYVLEQFVISRIHIHHVLGIKVSLRELVQQLNVPFDFTVHDYYTICPQITLLTGSQYCGEPDLAECNACIRSRPSFGARDILSWRKEHEWLLVHADRVICPTEDVRQRLTQYGLAERAIVAPHESVDTWPLVPVILEQYEPLCIAVLGFSVPTRARISLPHASRRAPGTVHVRGDWQIPAAPPGACGAVITETGSYRIVNFQVRSRPSTPTLWFPAPGRKPGATH